MKLNSQTEEDILKNLEVELSSRSLEMVGNINAKSMTIIEILVELAEIYNKKGRLMGKVISNK